MVKVIELITTLNTGGAETLIKDYCMFMNKAKVRLKVIVMSGRYGSLNEKMIDESGVEVVYLQNILFGDSQKRNIFKKGLVFLSRYYYFRREVLEYAPDIIHVHVRLGNYFKFLPLHRIRSRLMLTVHNTPDRYFDRTGKDREKYWEYKEAYRLIHKHGMKLIALHDSMNKELGELFDTDDIVTISNGIDMARFDRSLYDRIQIRESLGIPADSFVVGHIGRLNYQKNHEKVLSVFNKLHEADDKFVLLMIGRGNLEDEIKKQIEDYGLTDSVIRLSQRSDIPELLCAMDIFLFPSRWEGYPIVLMEAQSMGLKCVISDTITEDVILTDRIVRLPIDANDEEWCTAILNDSEYALKRGDIEDCDMTKCIKKVECLYENEAQNFREI